MKRLGLAILLACCVGLVGCEKAKEKAEGAKEKGKEAAGKVTEKAKAGDVEGAKKAAKEGVEGVKETVTGDDKK